MSVKSFNWLQLAVSMFLFVTIVVAGKPAKADVTPRLIKDINQTALGFGVKARYLVAVNDIVYFSGNDQSHGQELWRSDGSVTGTYIVKDIVPGAGDSNPSQLTNVNGTLYFTTDDRGIWKSDGTESGTVQVRPGPVSLLNSVNGSLLFVVNGQNGGELWKIDNSGPIKLIDVDSNLGISEACNINGTFYFGTNSSTTGV